MQTTRRHFCFGEEIPRLLFTQRRRSRDLDGGCWSMITNMMMIIIIICLSRSNKEGLKLSMAMIKMPTTGSSPVLAIHLAGRRQREGQQHRHLQVLLLMLMLGVLITKSVFSDSSNPSQIFWQCSFWSATTWEMMTKKLQTNPAFLHWFHPIQFWRLECLFVISVILRFGRIMMTMEQTNPTLANLKKLAKGWV